MVKFKFIILILMLSLRTFSEAQTASLQLCSPPIKGNACQMSCTTTDQTDDIVFARNGNERGKCTIIFGSPSCVANTAQPSSTVTTFDIASLSRADDGSWTCTYGSGPGVTDTQTLTVLTYPTTPSSTDITHSTGLTTAVAATSSQIVDFAIVMDCTSPQPTVTWNFKLCGTSTVVASKAGNVAEDTTASTVCGSSEKNYQSTTSISSSDGVAGKCVETQVDILVNGFTAHTVTADFTVTFPEETTSVHGTSPSHLDTTETITQSSGGMTSKTDITLSRSETDSNTVTTDVLFTTRRDLDVDDELLIVVISSLVGGIILVVILALLFCLLIKKKRASSNNHASNADKREGRDNIGIVPERYSNNHTEGRRDQHSNSQRVHNYKPKALNASHSVQDFNSDNQRSYRYDNEYGRYDQSSGSMYSTIPYATYNKINDFVEFPTNKTEKKDGFLYN